MVLDYSSASIEFIRLRGVRQNNLKNFDLDLPLGKYVVVTGLSGAGKSSLVFDTLHAEGQRRYVETFSTYARQFLDLFDKPKVDSVENIRPSIAIKQTNTVKNSRSTVGTMTELTDFYKIWFSRIAECFDPETGEKIEDDSPFTIWEKTLATHLHTTLLLTFHVAKPKNLGWSEVLTSIKNQGYVRVLTPEKSGSLALTKIESWFAGSANSADTGLAHADHLFVVHDRLFVATENKSRFLEAVENAFHFGHRQTYLFAAESLTPIGHYSRGLHSPATGRTFRPATPALFSFNSSFGACPVCRGVGRVAEIDYRLAIPDHSRSIDEGAIKPWEREAYGKSKHDLLVFMKKNRIPSNAPFALLTPEQRQYIIEGEPGYDSEGEKRWPDYWYGVKGFFRHLETKAYKMHVRFFLSRYRAYNPCPTCHDTRLQPEALCWKWRGRTLPELYQLPISDLLALMQESKPRKTTTKNDEVHSFSLAYDSIVTRLSYLEQVGLGYLTLDRRSHTLSGGEVERVNLTACLGTSLVDMLFVLDEPSVGLHPRDTGRLISIIRRLADAGNTVVVVEHDESIIRAADHVIEVGPEPGARGGEIVFQGTVSQLLRSPNSITGRYFSGREKIKPHTPRLSTKETGWLSFTRATKYNLREFSARFPLKRLVCLSGASGSGKSTLLDNVIYQGLLTQRNLLTQDPATIEAIVSDLPLGEIVLVDQSPLSRTPRSNPALYSEVWDFIREFYSATPAAQEAGFSYSSFSFNIGEGRCDHCQGLGSERVEMQFLSDVFVPCPICEGKRFKPEVLAIQWNGKSVADLLATTISSALTFFSEHKEIHRRLTALDAVGLGYLTLGQPLNTLSGGELQRLKLVRYLSSYTGSNDRFASGGALLLLDEPTTGLHRHDIKCLLTILQHIVDNGHSVVLVEHNLDVLKSADWLLEIGPGAGSNGGRVVAEGTPETVAQADTATSSFLRKALDLEGTGSEVTPELTAQKNTAFYQAPLFGNSHQLVVLGARENNLRNISFSIPHRQLSVVTGVSGSGKSTLAFDIIFAEGQRRFMESMSPYARQFVEQLPRPEVDRITGIPPTVAIEQRVTRGSRKSTVATITEVAQYLRLLYARLGVQHHPGTGRAVTPLSPRQLRELLEKVLTTPAASNAKHLYLCAPLIRGRKGHHEPVTKWIAKQKFELMRIDNKLLLVSDFCKLDRYKEHDIEVVIGDLKDFSPKDRSAQFKRALKLGKGTCFLVVPSGEVLSWFSTHTGVLPGESFPELDPKHFSFSSPKGWCPTCRGHGRIYDWLVQKSEGVEQQLSPEVADVLRHFDPDNPSASGKLCPTCHGERLNRVIRAVKLPLQRGEPISLPQLVALTPKKLLSVLRSLKLDVRGRLVAQDIVPQIEERLRFLARVGLDYLTLDRSTETLSGGEAQRIRLAAQLGSNLSGVLYVLDEPSIGLHARDSNQLIEALQSLREKGNTLLVVEHDNVLMEQADWLIDLGPGAGVNGGRVLANGTLANVKNDANSLTGFYLRKGIPHPLLGSYRSVGKEKDSAWLQLSGVNYRNLANADIALPLGRLIMICGPSGAGKSTFLRDILAPAVTTAIKKKKARLTGKEFVKLGGFGTDRPEIGSKPAEPFSELRGANGFKSVIEVTQSPIGKTLRSTSATYLGIFDLIRQIFASLSKAKICGYSASRFSFNTAGGRCEVCAGAGRIKLEMGFMPDSYLPCDACGGSRYSPDLTNITWKRKNIGQVLQLSFEEAATFFDFHSQLQAVCQLMVDCGLGYLTLGQSSPTLSGGEAQRLKLVTELTRGLKSYQERSRGTNIRNLYLLEEPTTGLHLSDCKKLIRLLQNLVEQGHTVIVIEHHLDLLAEADYLVELGPGGGPYGGKLIYQGPVKGIAKIKSSPTAPYLRKKLACS